MQLKEQKDKLRNSLFEKYFEIEEESIKFKDLMDRFMPVTKTWQELTNILIENSKDFKKWSSIEMLKEINYNGKDYLIIKEMFCKYFIIDIKEKRILSEEEVVENFNDDIFIDNFNEEKSYEGLIYYPRMYHFLEYSGNIETLLDLYNENKDKLNIKPMIHYRLDIGEAWTSIFIDLADYSSQLHFQTPNQFLYEQLYFKGDLTPSNRQDAVDRIGLEKIEEMFRRTREIPIPISVIPKEFLPYVLTPEEKGKVLVKKEKETN